MPLAPFQYPAAMPNLASLVRVVNGLLQGRANITGVGTASGEGGGTVIDARCHPASVVLVESNALDVKFAVTEYRKGEFDVVWDTTGQQTFTLRYVILG